MRFLSLLCLSLFPILRATASDVYCPPGHSIGKSVIVQAPPQIIQQAAPVPEPIDYAAELNQDDVIVGILSGIAEQQQRYEALLDGLESLGFRRRYQSSSSTNIDIRGRLGDRVRQRVAYADVPYELGETAYSVRRINVDAFGPQDVRELFAAVARYSGDANDGANQIMSRANQLVERIASSIAADSADAIRLAEIEAEARGSNQVLETLIAAIVASKPTQRTKISVDEPVSVPRRAIAATIVDSRAPVDGGTSESDGLGAVIANCAQCHGSALAKVKGGFNLESTNDRQLSKAISAVLSGTMPPNKTLSTAEKLQVVSGLQSVRGE